MEWHGFSRQNSDSGENQSLLESKQTMSLFVRSWFKFAKKQELSAILCLHFYLPRGGSWSRNGAFAMTGGRAQNFGAG
jgi:hypothetical protein